MPMSKKATTLIRALERAAVAKSWKGRQDPADHAAINEAYLAAKRSICTYIEGLERRERHEVELES